MSSYAIQNFIDENKLDLTDEIYKKFCDLCLKQNQKESEDLDDCEKGYYKIKYWQDCYKHDNIHSYTHSLMKNSRILKLSNIQYKLIKQLIDKNKYCILQNDIISFERVFDKIRKKDMDVLCLKKECKYCENNFNSEILLSGHPIIVNIRDMSLKKEPKVRNRIIRRGFVMEHVLSLKEDVKIGQIYKINFLKVEYIQNLDRNTCDNFKQDYEIVLYISNDDDIKLVNTIKQLLNTQYINCVSEKNLDKLNVKFCQNKYTKLICSFACTEHECGVFNDCQINIQGYPIIINMQLVN